MQNVTYNQPIHSQLTLADFAAADVENLVAGAWNFIGYYQVGITEKIGLGYGSEKGFDDAQGRVHGILKDTDTTTYAGDVKIVVEDTQGNTIVPLAFNMTMDYLGNGASNLKDRVEYSYQFLNINRERRIALYIKPRTVGNAILDVSISNFSMSITRQSL